MISNDWVDNTEIQIENGWGILLSGQLCNK